MAPNGVQCKYLKIIEKQFLSCYPLKQICWQLLEEIIDWQSDEAYELQSHLIKCTYKNPLNKEYAINLKYQYEFLKALIKNVEVKTNEVHDSLYESLAEISNKISTSGTTLKTKYAYKHFLLQTGNSISMKESLFFVSDGTTGLCTWPASIALAEYLLQNSELIRGRKVLELGAGLGFCSMVYFKYCGAKNVLVTDGSLACLDCYAQNIALNFPEANKISAQKIEIDGRYLEYCQLEWQSIDRVTQVSQLQPDIVLGSDIIYESASHQPLIEALNYICKIKDNTVDFIIAFVVRNSNTVNSFLKKLDYSNYKVNDLKVPAPGHYFFWDDSTPVRIISIRPCK